jgi:hypothetical protein
MRSASPATVVFAAIGAVLLTAAVVLAVLGSFAYLALAALGLFFVAAALISRATSSSAAKFPALLALIGVMLSLVGTVTTIPFLYVGLGLVAAAGLIAVLSAVRSRSIPR